MSRRRWHAGQVVCSEPAGGLQACAAAPDGAPAQRRCCRELARRGLGAGRGLLQHAASPFVGNRCAPVRQHSQTAPRDSRPVRTRSVSTAPVTWLGRALCTRLASAPEAASSATGSAVSAVAGAAGHGVRASPGRPGAGGVSRKLGPGAGSADDGGSLAPAHRRAGWRGA